MKLQMFTHKRMSVSASRGKTDTEWEYHFALTTDDGKATAAEAKQPFLRLTTALDVALLCVRLFTDHSLLGLYHTGDPVTPQFVVAEFDFDDTTISHLKDHGDNIVAAQHDWKHRPQGELTATPPEPNGG